MKKLNHTNRILISVILAMGTLFGFTIYFFSKTIKEEIQERADIGATKQLRLISKFIDFQGKTISTYCTKTVNNIKTNFEKGTLSKPKIFKYINNITYYSSANRGIVVMNPNVYGEKFSISFYLDNIQGETLKVFCNDTIYKRDWYRKAVAEKKHFWTNTYRDFEDNEKIVSYVQPIILNDGRVLGVFCFDVPTNEFAKLFASYTIVSALDDQYLYVIDGNGVAFATSDTEVNLDDDLSLYKGLHFEEKTFNKKSVKKILKDLKHQEFFKTFYYYIDEPFFSYFRMINETPWIISISVSGKPIFEQQNKTISFFALIMFVIFASLTMAIVAGIRRSLISREMMKKDLELAHRIQINMLPKGKINTDYVDVFGFQEPAREVGGDVYFYEKIGSHLEFAVADVSGKGLPASFMMSQVICMFKTLSLYYYSPSEIVQHINKFLCNNSKSESFVTMFVAEVDLLTGNMIYCNAGHDLPLLYSKRGEFQKIKAHTNLVTGVKPDFKYIQDSITLEDGAKLILYTDGVNESMNLKNERYGMNRFINSATKWKDYNTEELTNQIYTDVKAFASAATQSDDITLLTVQYHPLEQFSYRQKLILKNDITEIKLLEPFVDKIQNQINLDKKIIFQLRLVLEEMVSNVINYAYGKEKNQTLWVSFYKNEIKYKIVIEDFGVPFDPTKKEDPNLDETIEEREIGGMGIFLVKQYMDSITYMRQNEVNILTLEKLL